MFITGRGKARRQLPSASPVGTLQGAATARVRSPGCAKHTEAKLAPTQLPRRAGCRCASCRWRAAAAAAAASAFSHVVGSTLACAGLLFPIAAAASTAAAAAAAAGAAAAAARRPACLGEVVRRLAACGGSLQQEAEHAVGLVSGGTQHGPACVLPRRAQRCVLLVATEVDPSGAIAGALNRVGCGEESVRGGQVWGHAAHRPPGGKGRA
eukprot:365301-Chlamydomonas_euryale.AAC.5